MHILHINNLGTGSIFNQVIAPLMKELENQNIRNSFFSPDRLATGNLSDRLLYRLLMSKIFIEKLIRFLISRNDYYFYNICERLSVLPAMRILKFFDRPDVIILYWTSGMINSKAIFEFQKLTGARIFLYPMDLAPITGGCHYAWDCEGYTRGCDHCPAITLSVLNTARNNMVFRKKYLDKTRIELLAATSSLARQFIDSSLFRKSRIIEIPIGIDSLTFTHSAEQKSVYKSDTGPIVKRRLLIGAYSLRDRRKGVSVLADALRLLYRRNPEILDQVELCMIGNSRLNLGVNGKIACHNSGYLNQEELIGEYRRAYAFICPSIEDAGPLMVNQSLMCGTPVVAFRVGVSGDFILNGSTGFIAEEKTPLALSVAIEEMLAVQEDQYREMVQNCRAIALSRFNIRVAAGKLLNQLEVN